jgi:hypothetical protein
MPRGPAVGDHRMTAGRESPGRTRLHGRVSRLANLRSPGHGRVGAPLSSSHGYAALLVSSSEVAEN